MRIIENIYSADGERFSLCRLSAGDGYLLSQMENVCFPNEAWSQEAFEDTLKNTEAFSFAFLNAEGSGAAYGILYIAADEGDIANIAVMPAFRGRGLGAAMLSCLLGKAKEKSVERLFLEVRESNISARGLYEKAGFEIIGKRRNYYNHPREDAVVMILNIN